MKFSPIACISAVCVLAGFAQPAYAALDGYSDANLNIRSGPSERFPAVGVLGAGTSLTIHGCLPRYTWCDVSASGLRGWASGAYIQILDGEERVYVPSRPREVPVISFEVNSYWPDHYRDLEFYSDVDDWEDYRWEDDGAPPGWRDDWDLQHQ